MMPESPRAIGDTGRLALRRCIVPLDTSAETAFGRLARLAAKLLDVPVAMLALVDAGRPFCVSHAGPLGPAVSQRVVPPDYSLYQHTVASDGPLVIADARAHPLVRESRSVSEFGIAAYLGIPLASAEGHALGALCVAGFQPRQWADEEVQTLRDLAASAITEIELCQEITQRKDAEEALRRQALLFDTLLDGVVLMDPEGRITNWNSAAERLFGYTRDEVLGESPMLFHHPSVRPGLEQEIREHLRREGRWAGEVPFLRKDGMEGVVHAVIVAQYDEHGRLASWIGINRDITERKRAEEDLRESAERFRLMVEGSEQVFFYAHDLEHRLEYLSPTVRRVLGYEPDELIGRPYDCLLTDDPENAVVAEQTENGFAIGQGVSTYTAILRHKDGRSLAVELVESPVVRNGVVVGMQGFARDVTERKEAEEQLSIQKASLEQLFENAPEAVVLLANDHRVIQVNPEFTRLFGFTSSEAVGQRIDELIVPPGGQEEAVSITRSITRGKTVGAESVRQRKDGTLIHVSILGTPIRVGGSQIAVYGIYRDISDRKRAEARLRTAEAHYRRLVENSPYGITVLDAEGRFAEVNPAAAQMVGRETAELLGMHFAEVVLPEDAEAARVPFGAKMRDRAETTETEIQVLRPSGERRLLRIRSTTVGEGEGQGGVHSVIRDVTDERARETQLRRAERLASVGTLVSGVAHELNNPLTSIKSFTQFMLLDERPAEDRESLEIIQREAERAAKIIADLRLLARRTQEDGAASDGLVDLNEVVEHILTLRRYAQGTGEIEVREDLAPGLPRIAAARGDVEQVVLNLVTNAEQAMLGSEGERRLALRTRFSATQVSLQVSDSGPGIRPEDLERIFDPFWTTKEPGEGTGLGLSLVHNIVASHGGEIRVESGPGGATFFVDFPRTACSKPAPPAEPPSLQATRPLRILVVDDEASIRQSVAMSLERRGHQVDQAAEGGEALRRIARAGEGPQYDVILADLRMPGISGDQLFGHLREQGEGLDRRLVFATGDAMGCDASPILAGANVPVLLKPFELSEVAAAIERHADRTVQEANAA